MHIHSNNAAIATRSLLSYRVESTRNPGACRHDRYRDFSGDGITVPTAGGEAFGDANAIAGQGSHVYDTRGFSALSPRAPCDIRIEGAAPGASLVALKVFNRDDVARTSGFLQAIDYAVTGERVNVLDESFGASSFSDVASLDAVQRFNPPTT